MTYSECLARAALLAALITAAPGPGGAAAELDIVIRNARIVDGTGAPWWRGELGVRGDTIVALSAASLGGARRVFDAGGRVVAPGFIDLHAHAWPAILERPLAENYARQGVTTLVGGPDGSSALPLGAALARVEALPPALNFASFVGHGSVRTAVLGGANREPDALELVRMQELVRGAMREGAFGLSTGLFYVPASFARTEEVVALARAAGELGGIHVSHMRNEADRVLDSVRETIAIGEEGGLPTQVTHHKMIGRAAWGQSAESLRLMQEARARGVDVTVDQYPYTASSTSVTAALVPAWALEGGSEALRRRIADPATRERVLQAIADRIQHERGGGDPANIVIAACGFDRSLEGRSLAAILRGRGVPVTVESAAELALEIVEKGGASGIFHAISEEDVERIMAWPFTMVASDGEIPAFGAGVPHPRSYGTFVRVLARYVRERRLLTLEEAIRRMTSLPAARLRLAERGLLRAGQKADLVVLDPATVRDAATFEKPHQYAEGVSLVVVNGQVVFDGARMTGARPGRVLRGPGYAGAP